MARPIVHSITLSRTRFPDQAAAERWLRANAFPTAGLTLEGETWRVEVRPRLDFADQSLRTITLSDGATATVGTPAAADTWEVEIFSVGEHGGRTWTTDHLDLIANNFEKLKTTIKPPLRLGHGDRQLLPLDADGQPAIGWVQALRRMGEKLVATVRGIPPALRTLITNGLYKRVSCEMYPEWESTSYEKNIRSGATGPVLQALSLLGAQVPEVKNLADLGRVLGLAPATTLAEAKASADKTITILGPMKETTMQATEQTTAEADETRRFVAMVAAEDARLLADGTADALRERIRGFQLLARGMKAEDLIDYCGDKLARFEEAILRREGFVDQVERFAETVTFTAFHPDHADAITDPKAHTFLAAVESALRLLKLDRENVGDRQRVANLIKRLREDLAPSAADVQHVVEHFAPSGGKESPREQTTMSEDESHEHDPEQAAAAEYIARLERGVQAFAEAEGIDLTDYSERRRAFVAVAPTLPDSPLYAGQADLAERLGGGDRLVRLREIAREQGLSLQSASQFETARRLLFGESHLTVANARTFDEAIYAVEAAHPELKHDQPAVLRVVMRERKDLIPQYGRNAPDAAPESTTVRHGERQPEGPATDAERTKVAKEIAKELGCNLNDATDRKRVYGEVVRRRPDLVPEYGAPRTAGPARMAQRNEPPAPAVPTPHSPWAAEGEFNRKLRELAKEEGFDLRDRKQRLQAIDLLIRRFPTLSPRYGFQIDENATPRNPTGPYGPQPSPQEVADSLAGGPQRAK